MVTLGHAAALPKRLIYLGSSSDSGLCCDGIQQKRDRLLIFADAPAELSDLWTRERLRLEEPCRKVVERIQ